MKKIRIAGASAYFADSTLAVGQLLGADPPPHYLMFDFMSEGTIGMLARALAANPKGGFVAELADVHIARNLNDIAALGVKLIANAGGLNPRGCAEGIEAVLRAAGAPLKVAYVEGDNLLEKAEEYRERNLTDMFSGAPFPERPDSINAYLGAFPIAQALRQGADIVVTGRCADSALGLGPLIHEFGWTEQQWDLLAAGTLVGHLLECGCQVTGGTFTDWEDVPDWAGIGYPIAEVAEDGSCVITKPANTGGLVSVGVVAEQLLYEVSDPQAYIVADVVCDFSDVKLEQVGENRVAVSGARGYPATDSYKAVASYHAGWRGAYTQVIIGMDAARKAQRQGEAMVERGRMMLRARNLGDFSGTHVDVVGGETAYGPRSTAAAVREVLMRSSADHPERDGAELFVREARAATSAMAPGSTATSGGAVTPISRLHLFLVPKSDAKVTVTIGGESETAPQHLGRPFNPASIVRPIVPMLEETLETDDGERPLVELAWGRSGDKGNLFNVAVIARRPEFMPTIRAAVTPRTVGDWFAHLYPPGIQPRVSMFELPGFNALNFVLHDSMNGGILVSAHVDSAAKGMAQQLLEMPIKVSHALITSIPTSGGAMSSL